MQDVIVENPPASCKLDDSVRLVMAAANSRMIQSLRPEKPADKQAGFFRVCCSIIAILSILKVTTSVSTRGGNKSESDRTMHSQFIS